MSNENSNSKNSPENKKRSWHKEPWYKRLFDKILVSYFLPCKHEWEVLEVLWTVHDYGGFIVAFVLSISLFKTLLRIVESSE